MAKKKAKRMLLWMAITACGGCVTSGLFLKPPARAAAHAARETPLGVARTARS